MPGGSQKRETRGQVTVAQGLILSGEVPPLPSSPIEIPTVDGKFISFSDEILGGHVLVVGGIGQGKTNAINHLLRCVRQTLDRKDIAVIFDPKGDYLHRFWRRGDIVINDPRQESDERPWNLMEELDTSKEGNEDQEETCNEIAHTLFDDAIRETSQPFFPTAAMQLFAALIAHPELLARKGPGARLTNASICRYWRDSREAISQDLLNCPDTAGLANYVGSAGDQANGVLATLNQVLTDSFVGRFRRPGDLSIRKTVGERGGRCVFIEYRMRAGKALAPVFRLLADLAIKEALNSTPGSVGRIYFFLDEFRLLPRLMHLDHGLNFGREFGLRFIVGMQSHAQVKAAYGDEADSILSGFNTVLAFRTTDPETRNFVQGVAGTNQKLFQLTNIPTQPFRHFFSGHVVEDHDIWNLSVGEAVVFLHGQEPFVAQIQAYDSP